MRATTALMIGGATVGAAAMANTIIASRVRRQETVLDGNKGIYPWKHGTVRYTVAGEGDPVLFIHSIGAGVSSFEWRDNFGPLSERFRCYAPDLLGFGLSDKPKMRYSAGLYVELLTDFIMNEIGEPASVVASSHSASYALLTAQKHSQIIKRLILICPAGMIGISPTMGTSGALVGNLTSVPVFGRSAYFSMTSRASIEQMLRVIYFDKTRITSDLIDAYWQASHQPGASFAVRSFLSGSLDADVRPALEKLDTPCMLVWGREAVLSPLDVAGQLLEIKPDLELRIIEKAGSLPHDERPEEFNDIAVSVLARPSEEERIHKAVKEMQKEIEQTSGV